MKRSSIVPRTLLGAAAAIVLAATPVAAIGPVDVELGALYWGASTDDGMIEEDGGAPGGFGNLWFRNAIGVAASRYGVSPEGALAGADSDFTTVDVRWRWLSATRNNFLAFGVGAERVELVDDATTAPRLTLEGRVSVKIVYFYARGAYLPTLGEMAIAGVPYDGKTGMELEGGVAVKPIPLLSIYAGYKSNDIDLEGPAGDLSLTSAGPVAGLVFSF